MSDATILQQRELATIDTAHNMKQIEQREEKLYMEGAFRTLRDKKRGMKRRTDESTWSKRIHLVKDFPAPGMVRDQEGASFATKSQIRTRRFVGTSASPDHASRHPAQLRRRLARYSTRRLAHH